MADEPPQKILKRNPATPLELVNHAFLLKKLPQSQEENLESIEQALLESLSHSVNQIPVRNSNSKIKSLLKSCVSLQADPLRLQDALLKLEDGESTFLFIRKQNCTMLFTKLNASHIRIVTFRSSLPNESITATFGDLRVTYPETCDIVPFSDLLVSECFSRQVNDLCRNIYTVAMPTSTKGGEEFDEIREASYPFMVSEFLVGMLAPMDPEELGSLKTTTEIKLEKKLRDQVNWENTKIPFRRSGLWTSVKVVLQIICQEEMGYKNDGIILYKICMLQMLSDLAEEYIRDNTTHAAWDVTAQMMVKLARRAKKLSETSRAADGYLEKMKQEMIHQVACIVEKINASVNSQWMSTAFPNFPNDPMTIRKIFQNDADWMADCRHHLPKLTEYISSDVAPSSSSSSFYLDQIDPIQETVTLQSLLEISENLSSSEEEGIHLNDQTVWIVQVERFARRDVSKDMPCEQIFKLMLAYAKTVASRYGITFSDPVHYSRMIATVLKFVFLLDQIAVETYPLLKEYSTGIKPEIFHCLLLPDKQDMDMVQCLQGYFQKRNEQAVFQNWMDTCGVERNSLAVRFSEGNESMIALRNKILQNAEIDIENKKAEVKRSKDYCDQLQREYDNYEECDDYETLSGWIVHDRRCRRCRVEQRLERERFSVAIFERPLPTAQFLQNAVVFELEIPQEISYLRDGIGLLREEIYNHGNFKPDTHRWTAFCGLNRYEKAGFQTTTHLGSEHQDLGSTHYKRPDVVSSSEMDFIRNNAMNCVYTQANILNLSRQIPQKLCTFQIQDTNEKDSPVYLALQCAMETKRTTENEVISRQYQCHQNLSLREFIAFGSIRCGHRVQIRNMYAAMASETLSLDKEPVVALIMQTLCEFGPDNREIHVDLEALENEEFCLGFLDRLGNICKENATNWGSPLLLMSLTILTVRILELSPSSAAKEKACSLLRDYRTVLEGWCATLENLISKHCESNIKQAQDFSELLLKALICTAFTFNVSSEALLPYILREPKDTTCWLKTLHRLSQLVTRENILSTSKFSPFLKNMLRHSIEVIPLNLEEYLHGIFLSNPKSKSLHDYVSSKWHAAENCQHLIPAFSNNHLAYPNKRHAYAATYPDGHTVCVDILRGIFLVDGHPPSVLPESIIWNPLYRSFFSSSQFRVQRDSQTYTTMDKYCGSHFQFSEAGGRLVIRQLSDGYWLELLPRELLAGKVPHDLVENYTHWIHSNNKIVHFRRRSSSADEQNYESDTDFILCPINSDDKDEWHLIKYRGPNEISNCYVLSIESPGFKKISGNLERLESESFLHVYLDRRELKISTNLWRFNLSFSLNREDGLLHCDNYPGYYISASGHLGTLVGLKSGIVLEKVTVAEPSGRRRMFIIQHGRLVVSQDERDRHQNVVVTCGGSRNPYFFVFEVDELLKRLRPGNNKSAWLYLALLHAATSSPFPDPFTQLTGTEMAMWILQSGFSWSSSSYDPECRKTLRQILDLSPKYAYYPSHMKIMQTITWPTSSSHNSYAAYDGYAIIVRKLLEDSVRLSGLFTDEDIKMDKSDLTLCKRSYFRNINMYNKAAHLSAEFIEEAADCVQSTTFSLSSFKGAHANSSLLQFAKYRVKQIPSPIKETVASLIMTYSPLPHNTEGNLSSGFLSNWLFTNLRPSWLQLYSMALRCTSRSELTMILGAMAYSGQCPLPQLYNLHNISIAAKEEQIGELPQPLKSLTNQSYNPCDNEFRDYTIRDILEKATGPAPSRTVYGTNSGYESALKIYNDRREKGPVAATNYVKSYWPTTRIDGNILQSSLYQNGLNDFSKEILDDVNSQLTNWYNNRNLKLFIGQIDEILQGIEVIETLGEASVTQNRLSFASTAFSTDNWQQHQLRDIQEDNQTEILSMVKIISSTGHLHAAIDISLSPSEQRNACISLTDKIANALMMMITDCSANKALLNAGILTRTAPVSLLRDQFGKKTGNCYVEALAVMWAHIMRLNRLVMYDSDREKYSVELARELETKECENWTPLENPEWLLLELELDVTIRAVQVQVARQMMNMPGEKNGVMQLNMGEGKTSVIIPMIVATLSSGNDYLCRVTVLNSIYATNFNLLGVTIGGFLNKRLYAMPCNRDLDIAKYLDQIQLAYLECMRLGGAVITLPEYRLSFRLQIYSKFLQEEQQELASRFYQVESWLRKHARDLVDESDEIFSVKYQLIYTTGKQLQLDGGSMRWEVCQKILEYIPTVASQLFEKYGSKVIEFEAEKATESPETFTHFRIVNDVCKQDFCTMIANGLVEGKIPLIGRLLTQEECIIIREFLTNENISKHDHEKFFELEDIASERMQALLLVSGYLRRGILFSALKKRWRVEFGVKPSKPEASSKLMAVPFRAKDVAAERTEFGHPDLAIILTQLSYYYSGLSDQQLFQCFKLLESGVTEPESIYNSWIKRIPSGKIMSDSIRSYKGINLQDYVQRTENLFPMLRHHKEVIDFWLQYVVFPRECRQFPGKLLTNAWDLCYDRNEHATTGFSGTNDTSLLLPAQLPQQDLPSLSETNDKMEEILNGNENTVKRSLDMGVGCKDILEFMTQDGFRVLVDSGALMLQLGNEDIARLWLEMDKNLEAVVYFSANGEIVIKNRSQASGRKHREKDLLLTLSPYKERLENCAIYLDDQHTRGTDIKFPTNFKACVTVGSGMRRDKLIQACMRMRKLGKGQSVHFYLSHEVHDKISLEIGTERDITVPDIINWSKGNSYKFEKDGLVYWATSAKNYAKNLAADDLYELSEKTAQDGKTLGNRFEDPDAQTLQAMYGTFHQQTLVTVSIPAWFTGIPFKLMNTSPLSSADHMKIFHTLQNISNGVFMKCVTHIPGAVFFRTMLEEEQEKELEPEQETEIQRQRPTEEKPLIPKLHPNVQSCVEGLLRPSVTEGISVLADIFKDTTIGTKRQSHGWGGHLLATEDFINVIQTSSSDISGGNMDSFLRPIRFFVSFRNGPNATMVLVLSLHEVNCLMPYFRNRCAPGTTLHMFSPRWMEGKPIFANDSRLQMPVRTGEVSRHLHENCMASLLVAAGNLFFESKEEQTAFARFLGLRLKPWTEEEETAFQERQITKSGFVLPSLPQLREGCGFIKDPIDMVRRILRMRNSILGDTDHAVYILDSCAYHSFTTN